MVRFVVSISARVKVQCIHSFVYLSGKAHRTEIQKKTDRKTKQAQNAKSEQYTDIDIHISQLGTNNVRLRYLTMVF